MRIQQGYVALSYILPPVPGRSGTGREPQAEQQGYQWGGGEAGVDDERQGVMGKDIELAILFADVVGSTRIYEVMGDLRARDMVLTCVEIMRAATEQNHGTVIKTIGDEIMATFPTANDAINAGSRMQHDIRIHAELKVEGQPIAIRIGGHFGPVVLENRDIFGAAVHTANRMTSQAKAGSDHDHSAPWSSAWRPSGSRPCVRSTWPRSRARPAKTSCSKCCGRRKMPPACCPRLRSATRQASRDKQSARRLRLRFQGQEIVVDESRANIAIGRAEENDIVVKGNLISRLHAKIELVRNKFQLVDQSTNGTFVTTREGEEAFVRRDSMQLKGEGLIGFGRVPENNSSLTVRYVCEE